MAAWPNFVPRLEFEAELKVVAERIDEVLRRLGEGDGRVAELGSHISVLQGECCQRLASKAEIAVAEQRLRRELVACEDRMTLSVEEVREYASAGVGFGPPIAAIEVRLNAVEHGLHAASREAHLLDDSFKKGAVYNTVTFATKAEHHEAWIRLQRDMASTATELRTVLENLEVAKASKGYVEAEFDGVHAKHTEMELALTEARAGLDRARWDAERLEVHCRDNLATRETLQQAEDVLAEVGRRSEKATQLGEELQEKVQAEADLVRRTIQQFQLGSAEVSSTLEKIYDLYASRQEVGERIDRIEEEMVGLDNREKDHWDQHQRSKEQWTQAHCDVEVTCESLRQEMHAQANTNKAQAEVLNNQTTQNFLDQVDKALQLQQSMDKIESEHQYMHTALQSVNQTALRMQTP